MAYNYRFPARTTCNGNSDNVFLHARTSGKGRSTTSDKLSGDILEKVNTFKYMGVVVEASGGMHM